MILFATLSLNKVNIVSFKYGTGFIILMLVIVISLSACSNREKKAGQTLVRVNGEEITVLQLNNEYKLAGITADQQVAATGKLLDSLIDRHLITEEAMRNKIDRTPEVIQAIERAKAEIIAQTYLDSIANRVTKPSLTEINDYFKNHPEYFAQRKQFDIQQIVIGTKDLNDELKLILDNAKSLDVVTDWLDTHSVHYARGQLSRNIIDMPEQMVVKFKEIQKGQFFIVNEGENSLLNYITNIKNSPVTAENAAPQIEQYLILKKSREITEAEIAHLRASAKIEYLNAQASTAH